MSEPYTSIQSDMNTRFTLLQEAKALEAQAKILRDRASYNNLDLEIRSLHNEVFILLDKVDLLKSLLSLVFKLFGDSDELVVIYLQDYQNCSFQGRSIEMIEKELVDLTKRIVFLCDLLSQMCGYVGHDFKFMKVESILDFSGLEISFEDREIHCCAICGDVQYLDSNEDKKHPDNTKLDYLEKLRKARKVKIYESKFKIEDNLHR